MAARTALTSAILYIADEFFFIELDLLVEDYIENGIDVGNAHLTVAVHVSIGFTAAREYHVHHGIDVGDAHLAVTVHVTWQDGRRIKA